MKNKLLIVDDHPILRQGVAALLSTMESVELCAQAANKFEAFRELERHRPQVAIVDISLGDSSQGGLELVRDMKRIVPSLKILAFSMHDESVYAERALTAGASGYLMKKEPASKILEAVDWIIKGNIYVSPKVSQSILRGAVTQPHERDCEGKHAAARTESLTKREFEILQELSTGRAPYIIAKNLGISVKTLDVHKANIKKKLHLKSASELNEFSINYFRPATV